MEEASGDAFSELQQNVGQSVWQIRDILTRVEGLKDNPLDNEYSHDDHLANHSGGNDSDPHNNYNDDDDRERSGELQEQQEHRGEASNHHQFQPPQVPRSHHQEVRHCLTQLDRAVDFLEEAIGRYMEADNSEDNTNGHVYPPFLPETAVSLREQLLNILIIIDLVELHVHDDYRIHQLHYRLLRNTYGVLDHWCLQFQELQSAESSELFEKVLKFLNQRQGEEYAFFQTSCQEEMATFGWLLSHVNEAYAYSAYSNDFESILGDNASVLLEVLYLFLPAGIAALELSTCESFQNSANATSNHVYEQVWSMVDLLLRHVIYRISVKDEVRSKNEPGCWLFEWLNEQFMAIAHRQDQGNRDFCDPKIAASKAKTFQNSIQKYASKFLDFTLDSLDAAAMNSSRLVEHNSTTVSVDGSGSRGSGSRGSGSRGSGSRGSGSSGVAYTSQDTNHSAQTQREEVQYNTHLIRTIRFCSFACTSLKLTINGSDEQFKSTSSRLLWMAYTKFFLAVDTTAAMSSDHDVAESTEVFVKVAALTLNGQVANICHRSGTLQVVDEVPERSMHDTDFDQGLQHALSVTFLSALEFPRILLENGDFLLQIESIAKRNDEMRHLVQGAVLRQLVMPTSGTARQPTAMEEVTQSLIKIGLQTNNKAAVPAQVDPWNQFFREQLAKLSVFEDTVGI